MYTSSTSQSWGQIRRHSVAIYQSGNWSAVFNKKMVAVAISNKDHRYRNLRLFGFTEQTIQRFKLYNGNSCVFLLLNWPRPVLKDLQVNKPIHNSFSANDCEA